MLMRMLTQDQVVKMADVIEESLANYRRAWFDRDETTGQYWIAITKAKLQIVNIIGGEKLAKKICDIIEEREENEADRRNKAAEENQDADDDFAYEHQNLTSAFDHIATGTIDGWYC